MRGMLIRSLSFASAQDVVRPRSSTRVLVATASFVLTLGAAFVLAEGEAFAQEETTPTEQPAPADPSTPTEQPAPASTTPPPTTPAATAPPAPPPAIATTDEENNAAEEEARRAAAQKELDLTKESPKAVYFSGDFGFTRSDLGGLSDSTGFDRTVATGLFYGLGAGLRLKDVRMGALWRVYDTTEFALWTFALSAGYGLPLRPVSPVLSAHVGYVFDQDIQSSLYRKSLAPGIVLPPDVDMKGLLVGVDLNASYWVTRFVRLGAFIGADLMFLSRSKTAVPYSIFGTPEEFSSLPLYSDSGSAVGLNFNAGLRGAFDIAFK